MRNYSELWILMGFNEIYILGGGGGEFLGNRYTILCLGNNYYDLFFFFNHSCNYFLVFWAFNFIVFL
jgi:hypothetical protein